LYFQKLVVSEGSVAREEIQESCLNSKFLVSRLNESLVTEHTLGVFELFISRIFISKSPRKLAITCVFLQWCACEAASCPRHKTLNEDINFGLHVTAPLKKHFVNGWRPSPLLVFLMLCQTMGLCHSTCLVSFFPYICQE